MTSSEKFKSRVPPERIQRYFERLGFDPVIYNEGQEKTGVRKNVLQLYRYCQSFISELDDADPKIIQVLGSPERGSLIGVIVRCSKLIFGGRSRGFRNN